MFKRDARSVSQKNEIVDCLLKREPMSQQGDRKVSQVVPRAQSQQQDRPVESPDQEGKTVILCHLVRE